MMKEIDLDSTIAYIEATCGHLKLSELEDALRYFEIFFEEGCRDKKTAIYIEAMKACVEKRRNG